MRVLVTGCSGFLGSHTAEALIARGHTVEGVDDLSTGRPEWFNPLRVTDFSEAPLGAEVIVHCAAVADISRNWVVQDNRDAIWATNVDSLIVLLERFENPETRPKRFIFVSTAAVMAPQVSPYTASKIAGEAFCQAYCQRWGIDLVIVRPVSMLGPRYHHGHVADFVRRGDKISPHGSLTKPNPYTHVKHVASHLADAVSGEGGGNWLGRRWRAIDTLVLLGASVIESGAERIADPDVDAYEEGSPAEWVQETIDWLKANRPWEHR